MKWHSEKKIRSRKSKGSFSLDTQDTSSDEEDDQLFKLKLSKLVQSDYEFTPFQAEAAKYPMTPDTSLSNSEKSSLFSFDDDEKPLENGGDFFSKFYFDKLVSDMEAVF